MMGDTTSRGIGVITSAWIIAMGTGTTTAMGIGIMIDITIGMKGVIEANFGRHGVSDW
jgi:hypothetical protein